MAMTWISLRYPLGKSGLMGLSIALAVRISLVPGLPSRLMKPPLIPGGVAHFLILHHQREEIYPFAFLFFSRRSR